MASHHPDAHCVVVLTAKIKDEKGVGITTKIYFIDVAVCVCAILVPCSFGTRHSPKPPRTAKSKQMHDHRADATIRAPGVAMTLIPDSRKAANRDLQALEDMSGQHLHAPQSHTAMTQLLQEALSRDSVVVNVFRYHVPIRLPRTYAMTLGSWFPLASCPCEGAGTNIIALLLFIKAYAITTVSSSHFDPVLPPVSDGKRRQSASWCIAPCWNSRRLRLMTTTSTNKFPITDRQFLIHVLNPKG